MKVIFKIFGFIISVAILVANPNLFMFICFAMAPAIVAYLIDRLPGKNISTTVMLFNLAGVSIFTFKILTGSSSMSNIASAINLQWIMVVYLFAAGGWFCVWIVPKIVIALSEYSYERKIETMEEKMAELVEEWGDEVKN